MAHTARLRLIVAAILLLLSLTQVTVSAIRVNGFFDLPAFTGASRALFAGNSPYAHGYTNQIDSVVFLYPPAAAAWLAPFILIPEKYLTQLFTVLSVVAFVISLWLSFRLRDEQFRVWEKLLMIALLLQTFPLKLTLMLGQINTFVLLLMAASLYLLGRNKIMMSAFLLSGAVVIKLIPIAFIGLAIIRRQYRWVLLSLGFVAVSSLLFFNESVIFVTEVLPGLLGGSPAADDMFNQSLAALFHRSSLGRFALPLTLLTVALLLYFLLRKTRLLPVWQQMVALLPVLVLIAANGWQHHLVLMYPFLLLFVGRWRWFVPFWALLALRPSYVVAIFPTPSLLWSYHTLGILVLVCCYLLFDTSRNLTQKAAPQTVNLPSA